jgi:hypothetical protein
MAILHYDNDIKRDTHVYSDSVYIGDGQGCGTVWYPTVQQARKIVNQLDEVPVGQDAGLCHLCKCSYSIHSDDWKKAKYEYACKQWKEDVASGKISNIKG